MPEEFRVERVGYDHPDASALTAEVQAYYVTLYGGPDSAPVAVDEFAPPRGAFFVGYLDQVPVATGGWRFSDYPVPGSSRPAEIKRMYVAERARRRGLARKVLQALERSAAEAGADWIVLETGRVQTAAISLYRAEGYAEVPAFGFYADEPGAVSLGRRLPAADASRDPLRI